MLSHFSLEVGKSNKSNFRDLILQDFTINIKDNILFQNADFEISFGQRIGIIGKNGIGKTTLMKHIAQRNFL